MRVLSWNLLKADGAGVADIARLVKRHRPDLVLLQEATGAIDALQGRLGGRFAREAMPGRHHGPAAWSPLAFEAVAVALPLAGRLDLPVPIFRAVLPRLALLVRQGELQVANVHLDHGQRANRRQLRHLRDRLPGLDLVMGDFNALGPTSLAGFRDVGPRRATHRAYGIVPVRLDRCLARGLRCTAATALAFGNSDHRPILVELVPDRDVGATGGG